MTIGQHKAISIRPSGIGRVVLQMTREQRLSHFGHSHRCARMPGVRLLNSIHSQCADSVGQFDRGVVGLAHAVGP